MYNTLIYRLERWNMYSFEERNTYFINTIKRLKSSNLVEGIIQLGSGVIGYKDEHSDIYLLVATSFSNWENEYFINKAVKYNMNIDVAFYKFNYDCAILF